MFKSICGKIFFPLVLLISISFVSANEVNIAIIHTADVHGNVAGSGIDRRSREIGGLLRCATLVNETREESGVNVILIDCGDLFQGSAESFLTRGYIVADAVKLMRYDALVVGNHEFDWGVDALWNFYRRAGIPALAADIFQPDGEILIYPEKIKPFIVKDFDGVRIIVIGLSNPHIPRWFTSATLDNLVFMDSIRALRDIMPQARALSPDIIVLATHQGYREWGDNSANQINTIAANFPELDVIIGAHNHTAVEEAEINGILYTQAEPYGRSLGRIDITFNTKQRRILKRRSRLLPVSSSVPSCPVLSSELEQELAVADKWLKTVIGSAIHDHTPVSVTPGQSSIQTLIASAIAERTGADVVFHGTLSSSIIYAGDIRIRDVWRIVPYENTIGTVELTLSELKEILVENSRYFKSSQFRGVYGIVYQWDFIDDQPHIGDITLTGNMADNYSAEHTDRRFKVAFNSFDLASAGARFPLLREITSRPAANMNDTGLDTRQVVIDFIKKQGKLDIKAAPGIIQR